jgi:hypothetical protein
MKTMENLIKATGNKKIGNHRKEINSDTTSYIYHWQAIIVVDEQNKTFITDNGGWRTHSTICAINDYKRKLNDKGYRLIN